MVDHNNWDTNVLKKITDIIEVIGKIPMLPESVKKKITAMYQNIVDEERQRLIGTLEYDPTEHKTN